MLSIGVCSTQTQLVQVDHTICTNRLSLTYTNLTTIYIPAPYLGFLTPRRHHYFNALPLSQR
jgi:hypothetical protein